MAPILPYLTDSPSRLRATVAAIAQAGARSISPIVLHLRPGAREWYLSWLAANHPGLVDRYRALYRGGSYADKRYQRRITEQVAGYARELGIGRDRAGEHRQSTPTAREHTAARSGATTNAADGGRGLHALPDAPSPRPAPEQLRLL